MTWLSLWLIAIGLAGCAGAMGLNPSYGAVVVYQAVPGSTTKYGVNALSDTGRRLFGPAELRAPSRLGGGGGTSAYGGMGLPKWVRVTWREPIYGQQTATTGKAFETLDFGKVLGDYKVDVASRLPPEVLKYASEKSGRAIRLIFRIKDDGVLLGWDVQEAPPRGGGGWVRSLHGGDFPCDPMTPYETQPSCTSGYLKDAPWYYP